MSKHRVRFVQKMVLVNDKKQVLICIYSDADDVAPAFMNTADFPGGGLDAWEKPITGIKREVQEEVGDLIYTEPEPFFTRTWKHPVGDHAQAVGLFWFASYISGEIMLSHEHSSYAWVSLEKVMNQNWEENTKKDLPDLLEKLERRLSQD